MHVDNKTFQKLITVVTPHVQTPNARRSLIDAAFFGTPLVNQIELEGNARQFASHLIGKTLNYGPIDKDELAVVRLLKEIKHYISPYDHHTIDDLIQHLHALEAENSVSDEIEESGEEPKKSEQQPKVPPQPKSEQTQDEAQETIPRLRWRNPLHWWLLLWWLSFDPVQIKAHDKVYGKSVRQAAGGWLANILAWLPLFIVTLALALRPELAAAWNQALGWNLSAFTFPMLVIVPWLMLSAIGDLRPDDNEVASVLAVFVAGGVAFSVAFIVAGGAAVFGVAVFVAVFVAGGVEDTLKSGKPNLLTRAIIPALLICYVVIAWVSFTAPVAGG